MRQAVAGDSAGTAAQSTSPAGAGARRALAVMIPDFADVIRPEPPRLNGERDQLGRKARFEAAHPDVSIMQGPGFWQAHRSLPRGSDTFTRWQLGELMDVLEQRYGPGQ